MSAGPRQPPAPERHHRPHGFDRAKRPRTLQKAIDGSKRTGHSESKNEPWAALFQRIKDQHRRHCEQSESRESSQSCSLKRTAIVKECCTEGRTIRVRMLEGGAPQIILQILCLPAFYQQKCSRFLQGRAHYSKSDGPSPRDGSMLRTRSKLSSRDQPPINF
jgi:hypothetical protein